MMGLSLRILPGVPKDIAKEMRRVVKAFPEISEVKGRVRIKVVPAPALAYSEGGYGFGAFLCPENPKYRGPLDIFIAGKPEGYKKHGITRKEAVRMTAETLLHELVHYEQWRDKRPVTERGVSARARGLYRRLQEKG